jgi:hypothetical protein
MARDPCNNMPITFKAAPLEVRSSEMSVGCQFLFLAVARPSLDHYGCLSEMHVVTITFYEWPQSYHHIHSDYRQMGIAKI